MKNMKMLGGGTVGGDDHDVDNDGKHDFQRRMHFPLKRNLKIKSIKFKTSYNQQMYNIHPIHRNKVSKLKQEDLCPNQLR